ncbi:MAG TPA: hypothetical protein DEA96_12420 [Leptospiraceae bacterium]|nr:hypothetical protein [Spirochaetaceae bacterium]HBS05766.1 hypothetical protein [Leptospiraceae bacterium]
MSFSIEEKFLSPVRELSPNLLRDHEDNYRYFSNDPKKKAEVKASIDLSGILEPIIFLPDDPNNWQAGGKILGGHVRKEIAIERGDEKVPVRYVTRKLSKEEELLALGGDNITAKKNDVEGKVLLLADTYPDYFSRKRGQNYHLDELVEKTGIQPRMLQRYKNLYDEAAKLAKGRVERKDIQAAKKVLAQDRKKSQSAFSTLSKFEKELEKLSKADRQVAVEELDRIIRKLRSS